MTRNEIEKIYYNELESDEISLSCPENMKCRIQKIKLGDNFCQITLINVSTNDLCHISSKLLPNTIKTCDNLRQHPITIHYKCIPKDDPVKIWSYCYLNNYSSHNLICSRGQKIKLKKVTLSESSGSDIGDKASCMTTLSDWSASISNSIHLDPFLCDGYQTCSKSISHPYRHPILARNSNDDSFHVVTHISIEYQCVNSQVYSGTRDQKIWVCNPHEKELIELKAVTITLNSKKNECIDGK